LGEKETQAPRRTGAPEVSRSELPTFSPEPVPPQGSAFANGEVRPTIASSQAIGRNVDEKMIGFVRLVGQRIESLVRSDKTSLEVQLVPEQLGKIDLKLISSPQGTSVIIQAESASTGWLIEQNLPQLRHSLTEAGVQLSGLSVGGNSTHSPGSQGQPGSFRGMKPGYRSSAGAPGRIETGPKRNDWAEPGSRGVNYLV
jgi:flagellar hook-length control protein FliK